MDQAVLEAIKQLRQYRDRYFEVAKATFGAAPANLYHTDFFFIGALNRSFCLLRGFCDLLESENFVSAAPLVRLQLDCSLRLIAADLVEDSAAFVSAIMAGTPIPKLKDSDGRSLTDAHLLEVTERHHPWIRCVYQETSGFVHLSDKHVFNALRIESEQERTVTFKISDRDEFVPAKAYLEALDVFARLSDLFLALMTDYGKARRCWPAT